MGGGGGAGSEDHITITPNTTKIMHILLSPNEEPVSTWTHYIPEANEGKGRTVVCPGRDVCPCCITGNYKTRRRHAFNVYDYDSKSTKILETGNSVVQQLKMILDQYGSFDMLDISIRRVGEKLNTQYFVMPMPRNAPFDVVEPKKFDLAAIKTATPVEKIASLIGKGGFTVEPPPATAPLATPPITPPATAVAPPPVATAEERATWGKEPGTPPPMATAVETPVVLSFGKHKGKSLDEIAEIDISYIKWCADNITDPTIKGKAQKLYDLHQAEATNPPADPPPPNDVILQKAEPEAPPVVAGKEALMHEVYDAINTDPKWKNNYVQVVGLMRQASQSPTCPNGKTILAEYTEEELNKLKGLLSSQK